MSYLSKGLNLFKTTSSECPEECKLSTVILKVWVVEETLIERDTKGHKAHSQKT